MVKVQLSLPKNEKARENNELRLDLSDQQKKTKEFGVMLKEFVVWDPNQKHGVQTQRIYEQSFRYCTFGRHFPASGSHAHKKYNKLYHNLFHRTAASI